MEGLDVEASAPITRIFPDTPGYNEDNGALLDLILRALPADRLQTASTATRALNLASVGIRPENCRPPVITYRDALVAGHIPALRRFWSPKNAASRRFARPVLPAAHDPGQADRDNSAMALLIEHGHIEALQLARDRGCSWNAHACMLAAKHGHLAIMQWVHTQDPSCSWTSDTCSAAAMGGHLESLQWLRAQVPPCPWDSSTLFHAALNGRLEVLQWAHTNGCPWHQSACAVAAREGHLEALQWLHAQDSHPWDPRVCEMAAKNGHLGVLQWARALVPPYPWSPSCLILAAVNGHAAVVQWLRENGCPEA